MKAREERQQDLNWDKMFEALLQYGKQHGHLAVPYRETTGLGQWCVNQRKAYKAKRLSMERSQKLLDAGFEFDGMAAMKVREKLQQAPRFRDEAVPRASEKAQKVSDAGCQCDGMMSMKAGEAPDQDEEELNWSTMFKALLQYGTQHGHLIVPYSKTTGLGHWCCDQR